MPDPSYVNCKDNEKCTITGYDNLVFERFLSICVDRFSTWRWTYLNNCRTWAFTVWRCGVEATSYFYGCIKDRLRHGHDSLVPCIRQTEDYIQRWW